MSAMIAAGFQPTTSLMDDDVYKLRMCYPAWLLQRQLGHEIPVTYRFFNRTRSIPLAQYINIDQLREALAQIGKLQFRPDELAYFNRLHHFDKRDPEFIEFMTQMRLPPAYVEAHGDDLDIHASGPWPVSMWWEMKILYTISEMFYINWMKEKGIRLEDVLAEGRKRRREAIARLRQHPGLHFSQFGARRRFSRSWEYETNEYLVNEIPDQLIGISNMEMARHFEAKVSGTQAHERGMVYRGVYYDKGILYALKKDLNDWYGTWGREYSIALPDLYGSEFFWRNFTPQQMHDWVGSRQDSGDPHREIPRAIRWYLKGGLYQKEIREKIIIPSDGVTDLLAIDLYELFIRMINISFGMGSFWSNNLGLPNISMIVKAMEACGHPLVKLSDNRAKALGIPDEVDRVKKEVHYDEQFDEQPIY